MNFKQIEAFLAIVQTGSFRAAADRLNCTQSTISARIHEVEQALGATLFDRSAKRVLLTTKGRDLVDYAEKLLELSSQIKFRVGNAGEYAGSVRLGVAEIVAVTWLPRLVSEMKGRFPKLTLQLEVALNPSLKSTLANGEIDIAILAGERFDEQLCSRHVGDVEFAWFASGSRQLKAGSYTPEELSKFPLIFQGAESATRQVMSDWLEVSKARDSHSVCNSMAGIASLVAADVGIGLLPLAYHAPQVQSGTLQQIQTYPSPPKLPFSIAYFPRENESILDIISSVAVDVSTFAQKRSS